MSRSPRKRAATGICQNVTSWVHERMPTARFNGIKDKLGNSITVENPSFNFLKLCFCRIDLLIPSSTVSGILDYLLVRVN